MTDPGDRRFDVHAFADSIICVFRGSWIELAPRDHGDPGEPDSAFDDLAYVISAFNPGHRADDDVNHERHLELADSLRRDGLRVRPAVGLSADRVWVEPSWEVSGLSRSQACAIGRSFGQVAVFEIDGTRVRVVGCSDEAIMSVWEFRVNRVSDP